VNEELDLVIFSITICNGSKDRQAASADQGYRLYDY